ncbi:imidazolonepropionase [Sporomusa acidovorans]|uniref:Imidazolonepropionase n=1 Tax=Sporomusa acidovorans (strain ATCC 49682 / DSM 3132 / Mol) TaxID=1123286 RepID=A0ABZ3J993_SPOA4|nr:imidazolonepropionase [Sporomusa acidovorans]OZC16081.1 imidazolonepropionase [Sporomusa acidovorans DSM 3132]SDD87273.1 imidazolonepropionase [Sporomusa acidovorans]
MTGKKLLIKHAAELITCAGAAPKKGAAMADIGIISDGALVAEAGKIVWVGPTDDLPPDSEEQCEVIDATGQCVMPGFVDSHTHMVFGGYRPEEFFWRLAGTPYLEILERGGGILNTVQATRSASLAELKDLAARRLENMLAMGVTTVEGKSGYGLDLDTELRQLAVMDELNREQPVEIVPTFLGAHAVPPDYKGRTDDYVDYMIKEVLPAVVRQGVAEFCDVFCEQGVFSLAQSRRLLAAAKNMGLQAKLHADEIVSLGGAELAAELNACSADHLLQASDAGIAALSQVRTVATVLPMTAFCLRESYARARVMIDQGAAVALATDYNPGSCFSHSMPLVAALAAIQLNMKPAEIVTALTINGAAAVNRADRIGSLEIGKQADVVILGYPSHLYLVYHAGMNIVDKVIKHGRLIWNKSGRKQHGKEQ